jgi:PAS domain S-box-containing protein
MTMQRNEVSTFKPEIKPVGKARWSIALKLVLGFGFMLFLLAAMAVTSYLNLRALDANVDVLLEKVHILQAFTDAEIAFFVAFEGEADYLATQSAEGVQEMSAGQAAWEDALATLDTLNLDAEELEYKSRLETLLIDTATAFASLRDLVDAGDLAAAQSYHRTEVESLTDQIVTLFDEGIRPDIRAHREEAHDAAKQAVRSGITALFGLGFGALLLGIVAAGVISRGISVPLRELTTAAQSVARGNLDIEVEANTRDEVGVLARAFNAMTQTLRNSLQALEARGEELAQRAQQLEANQRAVRVVFAASEQSDPDILLRLAVNLIRDHFDLYHVQVYLVDEEQDAAVLRESTGYAGLQLLQRKHKIPMSESSLVTRAITGDEPVLVNDVSQDPNFLENPLLPDTKSELVVPLRIGEDVTGVLDAQSRETGTFTPDTIALFETMTDQIALLFQNSELYAHTVQQTADLTRYTNQLRTAAEVSERLSTILDPNELLDELVDLLQSRFGFYHAHIYLLDEQEERLVVAAGSGEVGRVLKERRHAIPTDREQSLVARAARDRKIVRVNDTSLDSDFLPNPLLPQTRSEVAVPLVIGGRVLGVLDVQDDQPNRFVETDIGTLNTLAGQIGAALSNAQLFDEVQRRQQELDQRAAELETVANVSTAAATVLDPEALLHQVVDLTKENFDLYHAHIYLIDEAGETLELAAGAGEAGAQMVARGWSIPAGSEDSLVARAFRTGQGVIANDVQAAPDFLPNPLLPDTAAEMAVPMIAGERVLGVLDVQSDQVGRFTQQDVNIKTTLAEQVATALENARLYEETQQTAQTLNERLKEMNCLYAATALMEQEDMSLDELSQGIVDLLPPAWQYPDITCARIELEGQTYVTENFQATPWAQTAEIVVQGEPVGTIEVYYLEEKPEVDDGPFLQEERDLINTLARQLGDTLESRRAEQAIRELARQNQLVLDSAAEGIYGVDEHGVTVFVNPAAERMLGFSAEELIGGMHHDLIHHHHADGTPYPAETCRVYAAYRDGETHQGEDEIYWRKDGTSFPVAYTSTPIRDEDGTILGAVVTFRDITDQLRAQEETHRRAAELETVANVSTAAATVLDPEALLQQVVDLTKENFDLYHAHIYLIDEAGETLRLAAGAGEAGAQMAAQGWSIPAHSEDSLVARAYRTGEGVIANDVQAEPDFLPNPLLPDTAAEMAVPMIAGDQVLGVLDVQSDQVGRFTQQDVDIQTTLAAQVAAALENARLFGEQRRLTAILENSPYFIGIADREGRALYINPAGLETLGYPEDYDVTQLSIPDMQPQGTYEDGLQAAMESGLWTGESVFRRMDGTTFPILQSIFAVRDADGAVLAMGTIARDITEEKRTQEEIRRRAAELETVADVGTATSTILDPAALLNRVVNQTQEAFDLYHAHIYLIDEAGESLRLAAGAGEAGEQMVAQGWSIPAGSEDSLVARAYRTGEGVIANDVQAEPDFLPNPLLPDTAAEMAIPMIVGDQVLGVLDVQSDRVGRFTQNDVLIKTTLARQIGTALENARLFEQTREVDRLKSEFLANMSHELRTPLNSIIGYIQLLLMDLEGQIPEESFEDMQSIDTNSKHLLNLINDILDLAKIEAGRLELHMEDVAVDMLLDTVRSNNAGLFIDSPLEFNVEIAEELPLVKADQIRITQVLNNLISNAYKFTEEGGVTVRAFQKDGHVRIAVKDTGIGIAPEDLDTIFERFRQVDGSFTRRAEGTGLGLPITRYLVEMHGGSLDVVSEVDHGSTFTIALPVSVPEDEAQMAEVEVA